MINRNFVIFVVVPILMALVWQRPAEGAGLQVTWSDNSNNEDGFDIERRTGSIPFTKIASVATNVTSYRDSELASAITYCY